MNRIKPILQRCLQILRRAAGLVAAHPFGLLALVCGTAAAVLAATLPWQLAPMLNDITLAVARRIAGTGETELVPIRKEAFALMLRAIIAMALYLVAVPAALRSARKARGDLRKTVHEKRLEHEAAGHTPPPDWEKDVGRDIDHLCASIAALPEWLMLIAGLICCVLLLTRLPALPALAVPVAAVIACWVRDTLRQSKRSRTAQIAAVAAVWAAATLGAFAWMALQPDPARPLGSLVLELLGMTLLIPAALQLPYRNLRPTREALTRIRGCLK